MEKPFYLHWISSMGIDTVSTVLLMRVIVGVFIFFICFVAWLFGRHLAYKVLPRLIANTRNHWDDVFMEKHLFRNLTFWVPGLVLYATIPKVLYGYTQAIVIGQNLVGIYLIIVLVLCVDAFLKSFRHIYQNYPIAEEIPLKRFLQAFRAIIYICAVLVVMALILNKSLFYFFNGVESVKAVADPNSYLTRFINSLIVFFISFVVWYICRHVSHHILPKIVALTKNQWDDAMLRNNLFRNLALLVPGIILNIAIPSVFEGDAQAIIVGLNIVAIYLIVAVVLCVDALLNSSLEIYRTFPVSQEIPLTGFVQILKIVLYGCGLLFVMALIMNRSPLYLISGLGAMTAILMLVFKDPILGFVAGMQLISNRMLKQGDWIEMTKYGADGDVVDITLTTVKVRNFDKTITTIPTYALISDSFKNWRGMKESGGRRIKRAVFIDMNSIRFCDLQMLDRFEKNSYLSGYIKKKKQEIEAHNAALENTSELLPPVRRMTNIGTFRAYVYAYLRAHPMIHQDMTFLVRQLAPTANGLPLEVYVFCKDNNWNTYEDVQADIFDHLLAVAPEFGLRVYQLPSGRDMKFLENSLYDAEFLAN